MTTIEPADSGDALEEVRTMFAEYADSLGVDLGFQGFEAELAGLPGTYGPPDGRLLIARADGRAAGCVAIRPLEPGVCEMKRLYVRPDARGLGLGRLLATAAIVAGKAAGYRTMRLDTLASMSSARELYRSLGFQPIAPYRHNPLPGTAYLALDLAAAEG